MSRVEAGSHLVLDRGCSCQRTEHAGCSATSRSSPINDVARSIDCERVNVETPEEVKLFELRIKNAGRINRTAAKTEQQRRTYTRNILLKLAFQYPVRVDYLSRPSCGFAGLSSNAWTLRLEGYGENGFILWLESFRQNRVIYLNNTD